MATLRAVEREKCTAIYAYDHVHRRTDNPEFPNAICRRSLRTGYMARRALTGSRVMRPPGQKNRMNRRDITSPTANDQTCPASAFRARRTIRGASGLHVGASSPVEVKVVDSRGTHGAARRRGRTLHPGLPASCWAMWTKKKKKNPPPEKDDRRASMTRGGRTPAISQSSIYEGYATSSASIKDIVIAAV